MPRFFASNLEPSSPIVSFNNDPDEIHHLTHVLRLKEGDDIEIINGQGVLAHAKLSLVLKKRVEARIYEVKTELPPSRRLILACALPKNASFEDIVDKVTQLGVDEIVPLITERTEVVLRGDRSERKNQRFLKVAMSAVKQSKRLWAPVIHPVMTFPQALHAFSLPDRVSFIPWLGEDRISINQMPEHCKGVKSIMFYIGPEGDFSSEEVAMARERGVFPLSLGENVLRVDTAAIAVIAAAKLFV